MLFIIIIIIIILVVLFWQHKLNRVYLFILNILTPQLYTILLTHDMF